MIEMLQQPKMPAAKAASNPSKIDPAGHESGAASPSEASFDQQLDQQIRQGSNSRQQAVPGEKSNVNQGAKEPEAVEVSDQESVDQPSVEMTGALSSEMESEQLMLEMAIDGEAVTDSELFAHMTGTDRGMEQNLPLDGKDLPPELVALITPQTEVAETLVQQTLPHKAGASDKTLVMENTVMKSPMMNTNTSANTQLVLEGGQAMEDAAEFKLPELKIQLAQQNGDNQLPANKLSTLFASVAAVASSQQQVPLTTSIAALNLPSHQTLTTDSGLFSMTTSLSGAIPAPVQQPAAWAQGLSDQMAFMIQGKLQTAELKLNPAHLGPMEIRLSVQDDQASVTFVTQHAAVRDALDVAMPRLREMFESQGLNLANVDVSHHSGQQEQSSDSLANGTGQGQHNQNGMETPQDELQTSVIHTSMASGLSLYV